MANQSPTVAGPIEVRNQEAWARPNTLRWFAKYSGWSDPGEQHAVESVAAELSGRRLLDLGVGGGRTVPILRAISDDYQALDFMAPMVKACADRFPGVAVDEGDARDLHRFADGSFDLVMFSWNGIDAVSHDDRSLILDEVHRVLAPGGIFLFSTHNLDGPGWQERPWSLRLPDLAHPRKVAETVVFLPLHVRNHRRNRVSGPTGPGWGMGNASAHHFSLVIHYTTLAAARTELVEHGFDRLEVRDCEHGRVLPDWVASSDTWWFQIVARKAR